MWCHAYQGAILNWANREAPLHKHVVATVVRRIPRVPCASKPGYRPCMGHVPGGVATGECGIFVLGLWLGYLAINRLCSRLAAPVPDRLLFRDAAAGCVANIFLQRHVFSEGWHPLPAVLRTHNCHTHVRHYVGHGNAAVVDGGPDCIWHMCPAVSGHRVLSEALHSGRAVGLDYRPAVDVHPGNPRCKLFKIVFFTHCPKMTPSSRYV